MSSMIGKGAKGSRRRYLADQAEFMAEQWPEEFGKGMGIPKKGAGPSLEHLTQQMRRKGLNPDSAKQAARGRLATQADKTASQARARAQKTADALRDEVGKALPRNLHPGVGGMTGVGGMLPKRSELANRARFVPKRPTKTPEQRAAEQARASAAGKKAAQASAEVNRERRYGQHRALQATQRYMNREFNLEKREVQGKEFHRGAPTERYSAESARRRSAVVSGGLSAVSSATGVGALTLAAGRHAGKPAGQAALHRLAGRSGDPLLRQAVRSSTKHSATLARHPKAAVAGVLGLGATSAATNTLARFRRSEQEGISQGIGRIKAGERFQGRQERLSKGTRQVGRLAAFMLAGDGPAGAQAARLAWDNRKPLAAAGGAAATGGLGVGARRRVVQRRQLKEMVGKSYLGNGVWKPANELSRSARTAIKAGKGKGARGELVTRGRPANQNPDNAALTAVRNLDRAGSDSGRKNLRFGAGVSEQTKQRVLSSTPKRIRRPVTIQDASPHFPATTAMTFGRAGTRRNAQVFVHPHTNEHTVAHEFTHSQPRRGYSRVKAIQADPARSMREEARADVGGHRHAPSPKAQSDYEAHSILNAAAQRGNKPAKQAVRQLGVDSQRVKTYDQMRSKLGHPVGGLERLPDSPVTAGIRAGEPRKRSFFGKAYEPLKTHMSEEDAKRVVARHGLTGTLSPKLGREERMGAYEARYVASGGRKGEKWQRRAVTADKVKTGGLAAATAVGSAYLAGKTKLGARAGKQIARHYPGTRKIKSHHLGDAGVAAATVGGGGELYAGHARRKRSSYSSAPGGVAASALRRMQAYDTRG